MLLYVSVHQSFKLWIVPFYDAPVHLVTVLQLTKDRVLQPGEVPEPLRPSTWPALGPQDAAKADSHNGTKKVTSSDKKTKDKTSELGQPSGLAKEAGENSQDEKYYIQSQNDLYQTTEFIKFVVPWGLGVLFVVVGQFWSTFVCVAGALVVDFIMWLPQRLYHSRFEIFDNHGKPLLGAD